MNKSSFRLAFMAVLAGSLSGCASPMRLFAKKPQPFDEYVAQRKAEQTRVAGSQSTPGSATELSELLHQGHAAFQQGNLPEAQSKYFAVAQRQPNHPVANHRLGVIADRQQDYQSAQRYYFAALNAAPNDPNLLNDIGYSFLLQSRYAEAENYLQGAMQKNPKHPKAIDNLGLLYAKQGQTDRSLAMFRMTNSEAEAQAKVARLIPSGLNPAAPAGTMMANQSWSAQNPATMNTAPYNPNPYYPTPTNPAVAANGGQAFGHPANGFGQPQLPPQIPPNSGWTPPDPTPPNNPSAIAQTSASNDPNLPEATRRLKEQMEIVRLKALSERQGRDQTERQRQEFLKRQLRDEELSRANIVNPVYSQPNGANRWNTTPNVAPPNSNAPIIIGSPPSSSAPNSAPWQGTPDSQRPNYGPSGQLPFSNSPAIPTVQRNSASEPMSIPNYQPTSVPMPNSLSGALPPTNAGSPLDAMPPWPPAGSLPTITPNNSDDDAARAAARMGMNSGPGNMFPITPGPSSGATNAQNWSNSPNTFNNAGPFNGVSPTTPQNWPANSNPPNYEPRPGEPPAGTFGPSDFNTSTNSPPVLTESPTQFALRDRLPPSEQFQTPGSFDHLSSGTTQTQPASFGTNRAITGSPSSQFKGQYVPASDRIGSRERWENGPTSGTQSAQTSTHTMQSYLATPSGENSLLEYERMIQATNAETNRIRQQIDEQRQLPASENFRHSRVQPQTNSPTGGYPRQ